MGLASILITLYIPNYKKMPLISIIIPLYNKEAFIKETIKSVFAQSISDWELVIVDNCSTDKSVSLAKKFHDRRVLLLSNDVPGPGATRNVGLDHAKGEWIHYLDGDDLLEASFYEKMLQTASANPDAHVIASPWKEFADGNPEHFVVKHPTGADNLGLDVKNSSIANTCWAIHSAITQRSWLKHIRWSKDLDQFLAEDTAYWFRVVQGAKIAYTSYSGAQYRTQTVGCRSEYSASTWFQGNHAAVQVNVKYAEEHLGGVNLAQAEALVRLYSNLYSRARREGTSETADKALTEAKYWLSRAKSLDGSAKFSIKVRRLIGLKAYEFCKKTFQFNRK